MNNEHLRSPNQLPDRRTTTKLGNFTSEAVKYDDFELYEGSKQVIRQAFGKNFPLEEFSKVHPMRTILSDAKYALSREKTFGPQKFRAKNLEEVITAGVNRFNWLSILDPEKGSLHNARAHETYKYDDYSNRNDTFITIDMPEKYQLEGGDDRIAFSLDITYNSSKFDDKLDRSSNDPRLVAPKGYSRLKYYNDKKSIGDRIIPRFIIATDYFDSKNILKFQSTDLPIQAMRFQLLDEIWTQANTLKNQSKNPTPNEIMLEKYLHDRLNVAMNALTKANNKPSFVATKKKILSRSDFNEKRILLEKYCSNSDDTYKAFMQKLSQR